MDLAASVLSFSLMAAVVVLTPGLDVMLVLRQALRGDRRVALATAAGICLGALGWGVAASAGLSALFLASELAYTLLRWAGVAYLGYLAWSYLRSAWRPQVQVDIPTSAPQSAGEAFLTGLLTDLLNPKMAVFYLTVLPLFLPRGYDPILFGSLLAGIHALEAMVWFVVLILGAQAVKGFLGSRRGVRLVDGLAGTAMLGFSMGLALESH